MKETATGEEVVVIDDDPSCRAVLKQLFESVGLKVRLYPSGRAFLGDCIPDGASCLVLDVTRRGTSGLKFQDELARAGICMPTVFLTGRGDIPTAVRAMKAGAVDFLTKPFRDQDLLDAVFMALEQDRARRGEQRLISSLWKRFKSLSPREREVVAHVVAGAPNRKIGYDLGLSEVTVKLYRGRAMRKMGAKTLAELVRMIERCGMSDRHPGEPAVLLPDAVEGDLKCRVLREL
jgi:FixJ family two-component response regulator